MLFTKSSGVVGLHRNRALGKFYEISLQKRKLPFSPIGGGVWSHPHFADVAMASSLWFMPNHTLWDGHNEFN